MGRSNPVTLCPPYVWRESTGKTEFLAVGKACRAIVQPTPGSRETAFDSSGFSAEGGSSPAHSVPLWDSPHLPFYLTKWNLPFFYGQPKSQTVAFNRGVVLGWGPSYMETEKVLERKKKSDLKRAGLSLGWSQIRVAFYQGGLSTV